MKKILSFFLFLSLPTLCSANLGIYGGLGVGANILTGNQNATVAALNEGRYPFKYGLRDSAASGEVFAGWGHFFKSYYLGIEAFYSFLNSTSEFKSTFAGTRQETITTKLKDGYGAALRVGYQIQDSVLAYVRLGMESRQLSVVFSDPNGYYVPLNKSYRSHAFVPGLGMELKCTNNLHFRFEVRSAFYENKNVAVEQNATNYSRISTKPKLHTFLVGLVYRI